MRVVRVEDRAGAGEGGRPAATTATAMATAERAGPPQAKERRRSSPRRRVGAWIVRDAGRRGISHLAVIPCLLLTFMVGPAGLLLYLVLRLALRRVATLEERVAADA